ncbi:diamine acetyltransferase 2b isoform X2 [Oncorhynchus clarkii lewisi]|uniref:diamine acetyltransferase 2b isoform X2 n=1 Tax=Oncorhynchus clarkii lewisi TaxID=490388 RepID=UPI0039B94460
MHFKVRAAVKEDCKDISRMIMELAVYENMPDQVKTSHEDLERDGFSPNPFYECLIAEVPDEHKTKDGYTVVGYALYFYTYSTWKGRSVYVEDLYVMPDFREKGIGTGLMAKVAQVGVEKQCVRLQLSVLDWNKPSLDFYIAKGAEDLTAKEGLCWEDGWSIYMFGLPHIHGGSRDGGATHQRSQVMAHPPTP